jgi:hypothetical protein
MAACLEQVDFAETCGPEEHLPATKQRTQLKEEQLSSLCVWVTQIGRSIADQCPKTKARTEALWGIARIGVATHVRSKGGSRLWHGVLKTQTVYFNQSMMNMLACVGVVSIWSNLS